MWGSWHCSWWPCRNSSGGVVGTVGGFVIGATVNIVYSMVVDPILTAAYDNIVEPVGEWVEDKLNDLGDWWDSLWW